MTEPALPVSDRMIDLRAETEHFARGVAKHAGRLQAHGISPEAIAQLGTYAPIGVGPINPLPGHLFEPSDDGAVHVILPVWEGHGIVDLIAFNPQRPGRWFWRIGQGWCLSPEQIGRPTFDMAPLQVWDTPLSWLQNNCQGVCVLDYDSPEIEQLRLAQSIETDNLTARLIRLHLNRPRPLPEIITRRGRRSVA